MCKIGYFHIRNIASIRNNLNKHDAKIVTHAFVTSTLDYGNSLLYGINRKYLNKLQILQNSAARLIEKKRKYDHITETLKELHWLPVEARIEFKILSYVWKSLNERAPNYLTNMLRPREITRDLRQNQHILGV